MDDDNEEMKPVGVPVATVVEEEADEDEEDDKCDALDDPEFTSPKPSTYRQHSGPRSKWNLIKKSVDERSRARGEATDKWMNLTRSMSHGVSEFFGVSAATDIDKLKVKDKWNARSRRLHHNTLIGGRRDDAEIGDGTHPMPSRMSSYLGVSEEQFDSIGSAQPRWNRKTARPIDPFSSVHSRQFSRISTASSSRRVLRAQPSRKARKESVFKMTFDGVKNLAMGVTGFEKKSFARSRSFAPNAVQTVGPHEEFFLDDVFFDTPAPTSAAIQMRPFFSPGATNILPHIHEKSETEEPDVTTPTSDTVFRSLDSVDGLSGAAWLQQHETLLRKPATPEFYAPELIRSKEPEDQQPKAFAGMRRMADKFIDATLVNSDRRQYGVGVVGVWLDRDYRKSRIDSHIQVQIMELDDHRPFFTYWVTFVQIIIFIFTLWVYGRTQFGFEDFDVKGEVKRTNLATEVCQYKEQANMWFGPRQADLIHLGAKFSPCMRKDENVQREMNKSRDAERKTSCCIMNDGSGCFQASEQDCSRALATFYHLPNSTTRTVCRQDLRYCSPIYPLPHPADFTEWPTCTPMNVTSVKNNRHMTCDIVGRPCCVGIDGQCIITTPEHCTFLRGYFHPEAALCSQVHCLNEVCGMIPFYNPAVPDQFYRLWTSLFLHAGFIQLLLTCLFQMVVMRDLEKLAGWIRIMIIYIMSGIAGSLSSAIFLPYHVEAGPTGSQFGMLACLFVEVIQSWQILRNPSWAIGKLMIVLIFLFVVGLFPWIDNYAHLIGFIVGFCLSFALFPHITFNLVDERGKKIGIGICLLASASLFIGLVIMFYVSPIQNCDGCKYFNCIPLTDSFCNSMEVNITFKVY